MSVTCSLLLACVLATPDEGSAPHFETEILPILTKAGCNAGSCHGAAAGRGGFHLSLWGSDPAADYAAIVEEFQGRRVNISHPEASLIFRKPTGDINHEGGLPLSEDSAGAKLLLRWLAAGVPRGAPRPLQDFRVVPRSQIVALDQPIELRAEAAFAGDGLQDVSSWTLWKPADPAAVTINTVKKTATVHRPGQHVIIARFLSRVVPLQLVVPYAAEPIDLSVESRTNKIDALVLDRLEALRLPVSPIADGPQFLRRVTLDLTGRLPDSQTVEEFLKQEARSPQDLAKLRERYIDQLLNSAEFVDYWTYRLAELLRVGGNAAQREHAEIFQAWLREQVLRRTPLDQVAQELLTANGNPLEYGPANFYLVAGDAREQAEYVSQALMGVRLRCANCHNHPLDRWTQDDYHGFAAVFARVDRGKEIKQKSFGNVIHPKTGEPALPRLPGTKNLGPSDDFREPVADWLTSADNPYFAKAIVNRLWQAMFGRGLVHPTDDLSETNPATHPKLLDHLASDFVEHSFDLRQTLRSIAVSQTYQRSSKPNGINRHDSQFYSHQSLRPLPAEVLVDAWSDVTGIAETFEQLPQGTRAIQLVSPHVESRSLDVLGRCGREGDCEGGAAGQSAPNLASKLHLLNGEIINRKIAAENGRLQNMILKQLPAEKMLEELYLKALSRRPSNQERAFWMKQHAEDPTREFWEDFLWSLLTCQEFTTNH